jgi:cytochrome c oxidase cbb3-type subunit I/II
LTLIFEARGETFIMRMKFSFIRSAAVIACLLSGLTSFAQEAHVGNLNGNAKRGKALYERYCIFCHGKYGDGTGDSAPYLDPKPRDFTKATYKCRSTVSGNLPLDSDLYDTLTRGIHASGMPSWKPLTKQQRVDLVAYVKSFSSRFQEEKPGDPLPIPPEPATSPESVKRGGELFQSMNCWLCHGKEGRGNGPSAASLTDSKGYPITPFDLSGGTRFKCGESDQGLFRDLMTGLDGSPMPSFADALKPDQTWDIVHYIHALQASAKGRSAEVKAEPKVEMKSE